jgi:phospholipid-transporting ATPase
MTEVDKIVIEIFIWQVIISLVCSLFNTILENSYSAIMAYIPASNFWLLTATWWLLLTYFVPISLIVTMEMVKLFQGSLLVRDKAGYSEEYDFYTTANNTSVNENLGQIKYVFTDKTGTLTKNNMIFKNLICDGKLYGVDEEGVAFKKKEPGVARKTVDFKDDKF